MANPNPNPNQASDHWQREGALLLWRQGAGEVTTRPEA